MLPGCGRDSHETRQAKLHSKRIDRELQESAKECIVKLLLLGAGESGKSTFVKQMKIIHGDGYSTDELNSFTSIIHHNLLTSMVQVIKAMDKLNISLQNPPNQVCASKIINFSPSLRPGMMIPTEVGQMMMSLWQDDGFQQCLQCAVDYQLKDSAAYFFQRINKILNPSYIPDVQDVLQSQVNTTGIVETTFKSGGVIYQLFDVGGQRSERRKWLHCFDDVKAVLFVASLSGYDMTLTEDGATNRMEESLNLFQAICVNKFFRSSSIVLFLNKLDLFTEKVNNTKRHLRLYFPKYTGPDNDVSTAKDFIKDQYLACNISQRDIYPHFTTATDTNNIKKVFNVILEKTFKQSFKDISAF